MSSLIAAYVTRQKLAEIINALDAKTAAGDTKGGAGFNFTISVNDTSNEYGQNCSMYAEQTKEQRDAKTPKYYIGNGKVFWTDGVVKVATKDAAPAATAAPAAPVHADKLPF